MYDIHIIAVNQLDIPITEWKVQFIGYDMPIGYITLRKDNKYQTSNDFGNLLFDTLYEARDHIETELGKSRN